MLGITALAMFTIAFGARTPASGLGGSITPPSPPTPQVGNFTLSQPDLTVYSNGFGSLLITVTNAEGVSERSIRPLTPVEVQDIKSNPTSLNTLADELAAKAILKLTATPPAPPTISHPSTSFNPTNIQGHLNNP